MQLFRKVKFKLPQIRLPSRSKVNNAFQELAVLAGFLMLLKGLWLVYPPLMWIIGGLWLLFPARNKEQRR